MVQRYKFESKSHHLWLRVFASWRCFQWFKDTNLKANHNLPHWTIIGACAVSNGSKIQIWKQITTHPVLIQRFPQLFPMVQRYKFESKSQPVSAWWWASPSCFQWFKDTNLKANHNVVHGVDAQELAVSNGSKIQIWKQITTHSSMPAPCYGLFPMVQRYKFESKSQLKFEFI